MDLTLCTSLVLFGGSFDPPHIGHVRLPQLARKKVRADVVVYIPAALSPFKAEAPPTEARHRVAMLQLALADEPHATIETCELDRAAHATRPSPSYTFDTLTHLRHQLGDEPTFHLLLGADQVMDFHRWKHHRRILDLAEPLVMLRPPWNRDRLLDELPTALDVEQWEQAMIDLPPIDVSATHVRACLAQGRSVEGLLDPAVARYIEEHGLYRA